MVSGMLISLWLETWIVYMIQKTGSSTKGHLTLVTVVFLGGLASNTTGLLSLVGIHFCVCVNWEVLSREYFAGKL